MGAEFRKLYNNTHYHVTNIPLPEYIYNNMKRNKTKLFNKMVAKLFNRPEEAFEYYDIDPKSKLGKKVTSLFVLKVLKGETENSDGQDF